MEHWRRKNRRTILKDRWICLHADECELPGGLSVSPYYVLEEPDWVHIVAINAHGEILLVRQYRHGAGVVCTELPGGVIEEGETPLEAAKRELEEETGHTSANWTELPALFANPARQTNRVHCFVAPGVIGIGQQRLDATEQIAFEFVSPEAVRKRISSGEFEQGLHVALFLLALEHLKGESKDEIPRESKLEDAGDGRVSGLNHLTLSVSDLERSIRFYSGLLGFVVRKRKDQSAYLEAGTLWLALVVDRQVRQGPSPEYSHAALTVKSSEFPRLPDRLRKAGVIEWQESERPDSFYFLDPDGHKLELHCGNLESRLA